MSTNDSRDDSNSRIAKYDGTRGDEWRTFKRDARAVLAGKFSKDDRCSWLKVIMKMDEGGKYQMNI